MKNKLTLILLIFVMHSYAQKMQCTLKGTVINRSSKELLLFKATEDTRNTGVIIPIVDGEFEFVMTYEDQEAYQLIFKDERDKGTWRSIIFFPENTELNLTLHESKFFDKNKITGGNVNKKYQDLSEDIETKFKLQAMSIQAKLGELRQNNKYYNEEAKDIKEKIKSTTDLDEKNTLLGRLNEMKKDHSDKSLKAKILMEGMDSLPQKYFDFGVDYIKTNPSKMSYYLLYNDAQQINRSGFDYMVSVQKNYLLLSKMYPDHPYTNIIGQMLETHKRIKVGSDFIDFEALEVTGNSIRISDKIKGKVTLLNLWASWCGPCIKKSRLMIPIYEKYKNKGFTILGVAREFRNFTAFEKAMSREKYPWLNLIELDDKNDIWLKYNVPFSGGGMFLIDENGKILALNPNAEEVDKTLEELLN